jgi:hypothetical protein
MKRMNSIAILFGLSAFCVAPANAFTVDWQQYSTSRIEATITGLGYEMGTTTSPNGFWKLSFVGGTQVMNFGPGVVNALDLGPTDVWYLPVPQENPKMHSVGVGALPQTAVSSVLSNFVYPGWTYWSAIILISPQRFVPFEEFQMMDYQFPIESLRWELWVRGSGPNLPVPDTGGTALTLALSMGAIGCLRRIIA